MERVGRGKGFGKVVLFGDHFVIYGLPAIASAISDHTIATIEKAEDFTLIDNRPATEGYKKLKKEEMERSMELMLKFMDIDVEKTPVQITLSGNLFCTSGIGASAAMATSIARAFSDYFDLHLNEDEINRIAFEGEKGSAGITSGIDNTCATFGGLLWFRRNFTREENFVEFIKIKKPIEIVLGNTGLTSLTREVISDVKRAKESSPEKFEKIFNEYERIAEEAKLSLKEYNLGKLGKLMDENHKLLQEIDVSCKELNFLVNVVKEQGALGAKMTGTGKGGYMVALTPGEERQDKVAKSIEKEGFRTLNIRIG